MASYFGKFDSQMAAQQALDQGKLLKPFVAMWEDTLHYDDLDETNEGSLSTNELTGVTSAQTQEYVAVYGSGLYWFAESSESWITFDGDHYEGYGDDGFTLNIDSNDVTEARYAEIRVTFYYDDQHELVRNVATINVSQEAGEEPSTGATVTLSSTELSSNQSWQYLQVSDADNLYWTVSVPEWINNGDEYYGAGNNAWWFEVGENLTQDREAVFTVFFYSDEERTSLLYDVEASLTQEGRGEYAPSFNGEFYVGNFNAPYTTGETYVYVIDNPGYNWQVIVDGHTYNATSADTSVLIGWDENPNYGSTSKTVEVNFSEGSSYIETKNLNIDQQGNPDAMYAEWENGDSTFPSAGGSRNFNMIYNNTAVTKYSFALLYGSGNFNNPGGPTSFTANTADVATGVTFYAAGNTASTPVYGSIQIDAIDGSDQTIATYELSFTVTQVLPSVTVVGTFITTSDSQTVNVASYDGGNWSYAYIDGNVSDVLPTGTGSYTFPSAGTHTITYVRESSDLYLQAWFNYTDVVRIEASGSESWGCHGNDYYQSSTSMAFANNTQLTGATFDANCERIGSSCFSGCTSLVYLAFNNPEGLTMAGVVYPFDTITDNNGTLHIPSGATSAYSNIITALGQNWTVVDDL